MLKFTLISLFLVSLGSQVLTLATDPHENDVIVVDTNSTRGEAAPELQHAVISLNDKMFFVFLTRLNWISAAEYCSSQNLALASIDTEQDTESLVRKLKQNRLLFNGAKFWIGGSDFGHNGHYVWLANGRPFSYVNWLPGEPNNHGRNEHCTELLYDGRWNDRGCDAANYVICQNRCPLSSYAVPIYAK